MIGNLVGIIGTKEPALVLALGKGEVLCQKEDGETVRLRLEEIEGIPMTDAQYVERGFEATDMGGGKCWFYKKDGLEVKVYTDEDGQLWCLRNGEDSAELDDRHYLHEMQNAMKMLMQTTPKQEKAYISGPISGLDVETVKQSFAKAKSVAESLGYEAVSPVDGVTDWDGCWIDYIIADLKRLRNCAAIVIMNCIESPGMAIERIAAERMGLKVIHIDVL